MSKVLVVDDEPDIQEILKMYFEKMDIDIDVESALSGEEGVEKYEALMEKGDEPFVVMDLNLSGKGDDFDEVDRHRERKDNRMDGVESAQAILDINPNAVIWGYTAWAGTAWAAKLSNAGAEKIVDRIVPYKEFATMIRKFLEK